VGISSTNVEAEVCDGLRRLSTRTASDLLASRSSGSLVDVHVTSGPELRAEIVNQSVPGVRVTNAQDIRRDTLTESRG
jgi:hypothetical protein